MVVMAEESKSGIFGSTRPKWYFLLTEVKNVGILGLSEGQHGYPFGVVDARKMAVSGLSEGQSGVFSSPQEAKIVFCQGGHNEFTLGPKSAVFWPPGRPNGYLCHP